MEIEATLEPKSKSIRPRVGNAKSARVNAVQSGGAVTGTRGHEARQTTTAERFNGGEAGRRHVRAYRDIIR